jgi:hypothetical protein
MRRCSRTASKILPGEWQAAILEAEQNRPKLGVVTPRTLTELNLPQYRSVRSTRGSGLGRGVSSPRGALDATRAGRAPRVPRSRPAAAACGRAAGHARATAGLPQAVAPACAAVSLVFRLEASSFESSWFMPGSGAVRRAAPQGVERVRFTKLVGLGVVSGRETAGQKCSRLLKPGFAWRGRRSALMFWMRPQPDTSLAAIVRNGRCPRYGLPISRSRLCQWRAPS